LVVITGWVAGPLQDRQLGGSQQACREDPVVGCARQPSAHHGAVAQQRVTTHLPDVFYRLR
jgi:hypothetical protein